MIEKPRLEEAYFLGGFSCCGKTTVARQISERYGLELQHRDEWMKSHAERADPDTTPALFEAIRLKQSAGLKGGRELPSPTELAELFLRMAREDWTLTLEDFAKEPIYSPTLIEGARLPPDLILPALADRRRAVWLAPSKNLYREQISERDPPFGALERLAERYYAASEAHAEVALKHGGTVLRFGTAGERDELPDRLAMAFGLSH